MSNNQKPKFGDLDKGCTAYFINPHTQEVEPVYVMGTYYEEGKPNLMNLVIVIVPKYYRSRPISELDTKALRRFEIKLPKNETMVLVSTIPPTLYATTQQELENFKKFM